MGRTETVLPYGLAARDGFTECQTIMCRAVWHLCVESLLVLMTTTLGLIALLEVGDKTQLMTVSLATRYPWATVLAGVAVGLTTATAIGAAIGGLLAAALSSWLVFIKIGGGILFVALGVWSIVATLRSHEKKRTSDEDAP